MAATRSLSETIRAEFDAVNVGFRRMWYLVVSFVAAGIVAMNLVITPGNPPSFASATRDYGFALGVLALALPVVVASLALLRLHSVAPTVRPILDCMVLSVTSVTGFIWLLAPFVTLSFLDFGDPEQTIGVDIWGYNPHAGAWQKAIPLEAFALVLAWASLLLISYVIFSLFFLRAYTHWDRDQARAIQAEGIRLQWHPKRFGLFLLILLSIYGVRRFWDPVGLSPGLPIYPWFVATLLSIHWLVLPDWVRTRVNWRAAILTCYLGLLTGFVWEAALGHGYDWWNYQRTLDLGVTVRAWQYLPLGAVILWLFGGLPLINLFEAMRVWRMPPADKGEAAALDRDFALAHAQDTTAGASEPVLRQLQIVSTHASIDAETATSTSDKQQARRTIDGAFITWGSIFVYASAAALALNTTVAGGRHDPNLLTVPETQAYAYTWSLVLFILPTLAMVVWLHSAVHAGTVRPESVKAFWIASGVLAVAGFALDTLFGLRFFTFRDTGAVLGHCTPDSSLSDVSLKCLPAYNWADGHWAAGIPVEEFLFYALGSIFVLTSYVWLDRRFVQLYRMREAEMVRLRAMAPPLIRIDWRAINVLLILAAAALLAKQVILPPEAEYVIPGYALFLIFVPGAGVALLYPSVRRILNWPAAFITCVEVVILGMVWEAALGVPFNWWNYQHEFMLGIFVTAWYRLPMEAVVLWVLIAFPTIFMFETVRTLLHHPEPWHTILFGEGRRATRDEETAS